MSHYTTFEERLEIKNALRENLSFVEITKPLSKDRSAISGEVRKYAIPEKSGYGSIGYNACVQHPKCTKTHVCTGDYLWQSVKYCKLCGSCNVICKDIEKQVCVIRLKQI